MTIPLSAIVSVSPSVLNAGGTGLQLLGLELTNNPRLPIGSILSFPNSTAVSAYFGPNSAEYQNSLNYCAGFIGSNIKPGAMLFTQYNQNAVFPFLRGASTAAITLAQLQALSGTIIVVVNGVTVTSASINLASATSPSSAAALITTGLGYYDAVTGSGTTIGAGTSTSVTASITGYTMNVTAVGSGALKVGGVLSGTNVTSGTTITGQLTGSAGGIGTYSVSINQSAAPGTVTQSYGLMTVATMVSGTLNVGQVISGTGVAAGTTITALGTGTGGAGTYITSGGAQTVSATTISAGQLVCSFDSVSNAYVITGGTPGVPGTIGYASGTLAASIYLTSATGAVTSQGAAPSTPAAFMASILAQTNNFASFYTNFDPDNGYGNANKLAFANWNGLQNDEFAYVCWDLDITPTQSSAATGSLGYILNENNVSGTILLYDPLNEGLASMTAGFIASIDFTQTNGRATLAFKQQSSVSPTVVSLTVSNNLIANGYNFYGAYAEGNQNFVFLNPGNITGPYLWADSYVNQIWLTSAFQIAVIKFLLANKSVPYANQGYGLLRGALLGPITQAGNFGVFSPNVPLSTSQIAEVNTAAGANIAPVLSAAGYYLQILPASPTTRAAHQSPPINFWYMDGGSIQQINLASIAAQ